MDLNRDGRADILSGSYSRSEQPMAGLFQMLWGQDDGTFKEAAVLEGTDGKPLVIPIKDSDEQTENICTRPTAVDWDGDGKLDLVVGNFAGTFYLFRGEGEGRFSPKPEALMLAGRRLAIQGAHSDPFVVDWDGDGDLDLLSGSSSGGVQWAENVSGKGKAPELKPFAWLIQPAADIEWGAVIEGDEPRGPAGSTRVWADDANGDGKLDLLVGDSVTLVSPPPGVSKEELATRQAAWQKEFESLSAKMEAPDGKQPSPEDIERFNQLHEQRGEFAVEERTGFVWLYVRK